AAGISGSLGESATAQNTVGPTSDAASVKEIESGGSGPGSLRGRSRDELSRPAHGRCDAEAASDARLRLERLPDRRSCVAPVQPVPDPGQTPGGSREDTGRAHAAVVAD